MGQTDEQEKLDFYGSTLSRTGICVLFGQLGETLSPLFTVLLFPVEVPPVLPVQIPCGFFFFHLK